MKSVFLNHVRNQLWEPKFLRKQNRLRRPCINTSSDSEQHENTGKHHWGTGLKNCQGWPTAAWTLVHDELWWDLATQQAQPLNLIVFLHPTWSWCHYSERNWWGWGLQTAPKAVFKAFSGRAWKTLHLCTSSDRGSECRDYMLWLIVLGQRPQRGSWEVSSLWEWFRWSNVTKLLNDRWDQRTWQGTIILCI